MKERLLKILQHSLGVDQYGRGPQYRNHFVAGTDDLLACREMVELGYMREFRASELTGGCAAFEVTRAGKSAMINESPCPPKLTRSQRRYRKYLEIADMYGGTFGDWLKKTKGGDK